MISKLHVYEPDLKTTDGTSNHLAIATPDSLSSRARGRCLRERPLLYRHLRIVKTCKRPAEFVFP
jgi:hypothetical protein